MNIFKKWQNLLCHALQVSEYRKTKVTISRSCLVYNWFKKKLVGLVKIRKSSCKTSCVVFQGRIFLLEELE